MPSSFRLTTALVTSLSLVAGHMPLAAFAQSTEAECLEGESEEACLARALEEAAAAEAAAAAAQAEAEAAAIAEAEATALAEQEATAAAEAEAAALAEQDAAAAAAAEAAALEAQEAAEAEAASLAEQEAATAAETEAAAVAEQEAAAALQAEADAAEAEVEIEVEAEVAPDPDAEVETVETPADVSPATDEEALAEALSETEEEAATAEEVAVEPAVTEEAPLEEIVAEPQPEQTVEDAAELELAAQLADEAEQEAAIDPTLEAEAEVEVQAEDAEAQMQSLALTEASEPVGEVVTETITEADTRSAEEEFAPIFSDEAAAAAPAGEVREERSGLSNLETALLAGAAGLIVGSIVSGNRQVVNRADDRVVVLRPQGDYQVIRDDDVLLRRPGNGIATENFSDGSSRNVVTQPDGSQIVTIRDRDLRILRRTFIAPDGSSTVLIDDTTAVQPVIVSQLPQTRPAPIAADATDGDALRLALQEAQRYDRNFSLAQIRSIRAVRDLAPAIDLENVTFASGSAAIGPEQARALLALGTFMADAIAANPQEIFLVEGHTDAVGSAAYNLALSDRRAESVALSLAEYFGVPAQNLVIQGYGEDYLRVATLADERLNRRVAVRRITGLLQVAAAN